MPNKKAPKKKATKRKKRTANKKLWATREFKSVLSAAGEITEDGFKIVVENQREINTNIYRALALIANTRKARAVSAEARRNADKLHALAEKIPGAGPPGCSD
jgi:hypothetical protein